MFKRHKYVFRGDNPELLPTVLKENGSSISIIVQLKMKGDHSIASLVSNINGNIELIPNKDSVFKIQVKDNNLQVIISKSSIPDGNKMCWYIIATTEPFLFDSAAIDIVDMKMPFDESNFYSGYYLGLEDIRVIIWE